MPVALAVRLSEKLHTRGRSDTAEEVVQRSLRLLEGEAEKPHRTKKNRYDIFGLAVRLCESIEDCERVEHYRRKRSEALELGFIIDVYDVMGRR